jgi:hypothetical protein
MAKTREETVEDEEEEASEDEEEFPEEAPATPEVEEEPAEATGDASLDEILTTRAEEAAGDEDDDSVLSLDRDERIETLSVKVVPQQPTEFTCRKCYLVKHRSQLADKKRMLCRDCV